MYFFLLSFSLIPEDYMTLIEALLLIQALQQGESAMLQEPGPPSEQDLKLSPIVEEEEPPVDDSTGSGSGSGNP